MFLKSFGLMAPIVIGGLYMTGAFGGGFDREVGRPPSEVMAAVGDLDLTRQPGSPGTDASRAGGVLPMFVLERGTDTMTWKVMSGSAVAMAMTAKFEPLDNGARTRMTTSVARGDAPDDLVSPAFRSESVSHGLFLAALEGELNELTRPAGGSPEKCRAVAAGLHGGAGGGASDERSLANGARTIMQLNAMEMQLRAAGCDPSKTEMGGLINDMIDRIEEKHAREGGSFDDEGDQGVRFEAGKPMIDVSQKPVR